MIYGPKTDGILAGALTVASGGWLIGVLLGYFQWPGWGHVLGLFILGGIGCRCPPPYAGMLCRKSPRLSCRDQPQAEDSQVRMPFENRTAQTRTATMMEPTITSHSVYGAVSGISFPNDSRIAPPPPLKSAISPPATAL